MHSNKLHCPSCKNPYSQNDRPARIITTCGHSLCSPCLARLIGNQKSLECPFDKMKSYVSQRGVESFPINSALMQLLEVQTSETCQEHREELRLFCLEDKCKICDDCLSHTHQGHPVKSLKKIKTEANSEKESLEALYGNIGRTQNELKDELEQGRVSLVKTARDRLQELKWLADRKEEELTFQIEALFDIEKNILNNEAQTFPGLKETINNRISTLKNLLEKNDYSCMAQPSIDPSQFIQASFEQRFKSIKQGLKETCDSFDTLLLSQIKSFDLVELPIFTGGLGFAQFQRTIDESTVKPARGSPSVRLKLENKRHYLVISAVNDTLTPTVEPEEDFPNIEKLRQQNKVWLKLGKLFSSEGILRDLFALWKKLGNIVCLKIDSSSDDQLLDLLPFLSWKTRELQKLEINFDQSKITDKSLIRLFQEALPKLTELLSLTLNLKSTEISDKSIETLALSMQLIMKNLHAFKLQLAKTKITDQGIIPLFVKMKGLTKIMINLEETKITDEAIDSFIANTLVHAKSLEEFELSVGKTKVSDKTIARLAIEMPLVKSFILSVNNTAVSDIGIVAFMRNSLPSMQKLEILELYLSETKITDQSITQLQGNIEKLRRFKLHLAQDNIGDSSMFSLNKNFLPSIRRLEDFELNIKNTNVTDKGILTVLYNMKSLKRLLLNVSKTNTSDMWLEMFVKNTLSKMDSLEMFRLYSWDTKLTDAGVSKLFQVLKNLNDLTIYLQNTKVSDKSMEEFVRNRNSILRKDFDNIDFDLTQTGVSDKIKAEISNIKKRLLHF